MPLTLDWAETPMDQVSSKQLEKAWLKPVLSDLEWKLWAAIPHHPAVNKKEPPEPRDGSTGNVLYIQARELE